MLKKLDQIQQHFGSRLQENVKLSNHTTARVGGNARCFVVVNSANELAADVQFLWQNDIPMQVLGSGANLLVSDRGIDAVILQNKTKTIIFQTHAGQPVVYAESGTTMITLARAAVLKGFDGLVWASTIPGTLGGAVYGNAGTHESDMSKSLVMAEILHREKGRLSLTVEQMEYSYRSSVLKRSPGSAVILSAKLAIRQGNPAEIKAAVQSNMEKRRLSQPTGSCFGSTFKNPVGDSAGRLIEAAGLKGFKIGGVVISPIHANFMINDGSGTAEDYRSMIQLVKDTVFEKFGVKLELEIEMIGKWQDQQ
jgi:UDP-N-acetylmuramate dehydrogenase